MHNILLKTITLHFSRLLFSLGLASLTLSGVQLSQRYIPVQLPDFSLAAYSNTVPSIQPSTDVSAPEATVSNTMVGGTVVANSNTPTTVSIERLNLQLSIFPAILHKGEWLVSTTHISAIAPHAHSEGWVLYGHNWPKLFGKLHQSAIGDRVVIDFSNRSRGMYVVKQVTRIHPTDNYEWNRLASNQVLLYTCAGLFDRDRLLVVLEAA